MRTLPAAIYIYVENGSSILQGIRVIVIKKSETERIQMMTLIFCVLLIIAIFLDNDEVNFIVESPGKNEREIKFESDNFQSLNDIYQHKMEEEIFYQLKTHYKLSIK